MRWVYLAPGAVVKGAFHFTKGAGNTERVDYQQVGAWYWQTDGLELYTGSTMRSTFFHANDDVLKLYHSNVSVKDTVVWKGQNGPVVQWGWEPRNIDGVSVDGTAVIHNRMFSRDVAHNTCVFNSSTHWNANDPAPADSSKTVRNMTFTNTTVEGSVNCAIRIWAQSNTENIEIKGLHIDQWGGQSNELQASLLEASGDAHGNPVSVGDEVNSGNGLLLSDYTVGGTAIDRSTDNWRAESLGRLNFNGDLFQSWNAVMK